MRILTSSSTLSSLRTLSVLRTPVLASLLHPIHPALLCLAFPSASLSSSSSPPPPLSRAYSGSLTPFFFRLLSLPFTHSPPPPLRTPSFILSSLFAPSWLPPPSAVPHW
ncbi:hypothetical protein C8J57DRAFT_1503156 [Mycena rebaudengoi]|nr:hypothetical protein C8J57DRAFT_1503156 [Mycena rebaudengoi]